MLRRTPLHTLPFAGACLLALAACAPEDPDTSGAECPANLLPGDIVITEIFADAEGADEGLEWFELYNATDAAIDLAGVELVHARADDTGARSHIVADGTTIDAGQYLVVGGVLPEFAPAHVDYSYANDLGSLRNTDGKLAVGCNVVEVDAVTYGESVSGASLSLDGSNPPNATSNDDQANFCPSTIQGAFGGFGSPREANERCEGGGSSNDTGQCSDGGTQRDPVAPAPGALVITEVMPNPAAVGDGDGEWVELLATASFDLNGLELGRVVADGANQTLDAGECLSVDAGDRIVLANNLLPAENGGVNADFELDVTLANSNASLFIGHGGALLDELSWSSVRAGAALGLDPQFDDPADNDNPDNLCDATTAYGDGDLGTPGAANDSCGEVDPPPPPPPPPPGDMCNDNGTMRAIVAPVVGDLVITEFMPDPEGTDSAREWFEITALNPVDLIGLQAGRDTLSALVDGADCQPLGVGEFAVFARADADNGGLPAVVATFGFSLLQDNGEFQIGIDGATLDVVSWGASTTGASFQLDPDSFDPTANDDAANYCLGTVSYGEGGLGTPGVANEQCPATVD